MNYETIIHHIAPFVNSKSQNRHILRLFFVKNAFILCKVVEFSEKDFFRRISVLTEIVKIVIIKKDIFQIIYYDQEPDLRKGILNL